MDLNIVRAVYAPSGVCIVQRPANKRFGSLWSLPGGKAEDGERIADTLEREVYEELGLTIDDARLFRRTETYDPVEGRIAATYFVIEASGEIRTNGESSAHTFVTPDTKSGYNFAFGHGWVLEEYFERFRHEPSQR